MCKWIGMKKENCPKINIGHCRLNTTKRFQNIWNFWFLCFLHHIKGRLVANGIPAIVMETFVKKTDYRSICTLSLGLNTNSFLKFNLLIRFVKGESRGEKVMRNLRNGILILCAEHRNLKIYAVETKTVLPSSAWLFAVCINRINRYDMWTIWFYLQIHKSEKEELIARNDF